jgi:aspartate/methionine/tyrosine aminotransferase
MPGHQQLTPDQQEELIQVVSDVGAYLVWDAAFAELTYGAQPLPEPSLRYGRALSTGTLSKAYGLPGLRVGWCLAAPELLARMIRVRDYVTLHLSPLVELIAQKAIEHADTLIELRLAQARSNLEVVGAWIDRHSEEVDWIPPRGGVCAFIRFLGDIDVDELCRQLARERVLLVPGSCFGHPRRARLGFGCSASELEEGLDRLSHALATRKRPPVV